MISINTNLSSLIIQSNLKNSTSGLNNAIQRMTTGFKINGAKDNAAGYSIATSLTTKIGGYQIAEDNASMGLDMVQTASSSLSQMSELTSRLRSLAVQASNGTYGNSSVESINAEAKAIVQELHRIQNTTSYNGISLLNGNTLANNATSPIALLSASAQTVPTTPRAGSSGFIEEVQKRDTSTMTTMASVDENKSISSGTYSISTAEELAKLASMTNNGKVSGSAEFVLANDIDLSAYSTGSGWTSIGGNGGYFSGTFDGNGYKIKNLCINDSGSAACGLFGIAVNANIRNVGIEDADITGNLDVGALVGLSNHCTINNCYTTGSVLGEAECVAGLIGRADQTNVNNSYSTCSVNSTTGDECGGLVGENNGGSISNSYATGNVNAKTGSGGLIGYNSNGTISNCYATGNVTVDAGAGGLIASNDDGTINNCYATGNITANRYAGGLVASAGGGTISNSYAICGITSDGDRVGGLLGSSTGTILSDTYYIDKSGQTSGIGSGTPSQGSATLVTQKGLKELISQGVLSSYLAPDTEITLQVGINSSDSSQLNFTLSQIDIFSLDGLSMSSKSAVDTIDDVLKTINGHQTNLGAIENRLTSALEQISVAYDNLVSSRSTIRDADMAQESSNYIKMQILQQASATLLSTANQNPSIALQLI